jgi:O-methyltransferase
MENIYDHVNDIDSYASRKKESFLELEADSEFWQMYDVAKRYSMLQVPGFYNIYQSMKYLKGNQIPGALVEFGCFLGGAAIFMGLMRRHLNLSEEIILFDTFKGPPIGTEDIFLGRLPMKTTDEMVDYYETVQNNICKEVGDLNDFIFIQGPVEDTLRNINLQPVALARLDTDFYSSTKIELEVVYPKLRSGGIIIVDDYGYFAGARKATDEYFADHPAPPLLNRIDTGIWAGVKP